MAAFLNALKEEGTKDDCLTMCAKLFDDKMELLNELTRLRSDYEAMCAKDYDNATLIHNLRSDLEKAKEAFRRISTLSSGFGAVCGSALNQTRDRP